MQYFVKHKAEKLFVTGHDTIIFPLKVKIKPYSVNVVFIDSEVVVLPGCNPLSIDSVAGAPVLLPNGTYGAKISWNVTGTREIAWHFIELTDTPQ